MPAYERALTAQVAIDPDNPRIQIVRLNRTLHDVRSVFFRLSLCWLSQTNQGHTKHHSKNLDDGIRVSHLSFSLAREKRNLPAGTQH
jgi:hypothetical protein